MSPTWNLKVPNSERRKEASAEESVLIGLRKDKDDANGNVV